MPAASIIANPLLFSNRCWVSLSHRSRLSKVTPAKGNLGFLMKGWQGFNGLPMWPKICSRWMCVGNGEGCPEVMNLSLKREMDEDHSRSFLD